LFTGAELIWGWIGGNLALELGMEKLELFGIIKAELFPLWG
jgi:hypothetical protein